MTLVTHNTNPTLCPIGTHRQGYVNTTYDRLVEVFGEPESGDGRKVDAEWIVQDSETEVLATIYNYKDGVNYNGADGTPTTQITDWHVGGVDARAVDLVQRALATAASTIPPDGASGDTTDTATPSP